MTGKALYTLLTVFLLVLSITSLHLSHYYYSLSFSFTKQSSQKLLENSFTTWWNTAWALLLAILLFFTGSILFILAIIYLVKFLAETVT